MSSRVAGRIGPTRPLVLNAGSRADCEPIEVANDVPPRLRTQRAGVVGTQHNGRRALEGQLLPPRGISASGSRLDRKSTRLNSSHSQISYAVFCLKKKKKIITMYTQRTRV